MNKTITALAIMMASFAANASVSAFFRRSVLSLFSARAAAQRTRQTKHHGDNRKARARPS